MRPAQFRLLLIGATLLAATGCASSEEWQIWRSNSAHFASGEHMGFSLRNTTGSPARVTRQDIALAGQQKWFGKAITVSQEQILER